MADRGQFLPRTETAVPIIHAPGSGKVVRVLGGRMVDRIGRESQTLSGLIETGEIAVVGAVYDVSTGMIEFLSETFPTDRRDPRGSFVVANF